MSDAADADEDDYEIDAPDGTGCIELAEMLSEMRDRDDES